MTPANTVQKKKLKNGKKKIPKKDTDCTCKKKAESVSTAAHVTHFDEAHVTKLVELREKIKAEASAEKVKLTCLPFVVRTAIETLKLHLILNAILDDEEEEIIIKKYNNIGIAVDVPDGLIVPVIKFADQKSFLDLAEEIQNLAEAARFMNDLIHFLENPAIIPNTP